MQEYAADAQMWCHFNAPSLEDKPPASRLPPYGFPYDIQSSGWEPIMGWSARIISINVACTPSSCREVMDS